MIGRVEVPDSKIADAAAAVAACIRSPVEYRWQGTTRVHSFARFREGTRTIRPLETTAA